MTPCALVYPCCGTVSCLASIPGPQYIRCAPSAVQHFLALASVSNVGKALALAAFVATAPAFQQALCTGGNIADVTAKGQVWLGCTCF